MDAVITNKYIKTKEVSRYDYLEGLIFLLYFCYGVYRPALVNFLGLSLTTKSYYFLYYGSLIIYVLTRDRTKLVTPFFCYIVVFLLFLMAFLHDPNLMPWLSEKKYSVKKQMLQVYSGIWAFLIVSLVTDRKALLKYLEIAAVLLFVLYCYRFAQAQAVGYWRGVDENENFVKRSYDMAFGYGMLFSVIFFLGEAMLNKKWYYYILFGIGALCILIAGSRGPVLCIIGSVFLFLIFKWRSLNETKKKITILIVVFLIPLIIFAFLNYTKILLMFGTVLERIGLSSRTITSLIEGELTEMNGRDRIAELTIQRIAEGGFFGNGVFGERVAVGTIVKWGYAHNIILELYAAFGYVGGTAVIALLLYLIIYTALHCKDPGDQIIFITFLGNCIKLFLSDSFWFNRHFWALLAIMIMWRNQDRFQTQKGKPCKYIKY